MTATSNVPFNPEIDLKLERTLDVPKELLWKAWIQPEHVKHWFAPKPWEITACEIDLRPGGKFHFVMRSPEGQEYPNTSCYLEIVPNTKLVWTDALQPGYRPAENPFFTAVLLMESQGKGTKYTALALHRDVEGRKRHEEMGFHEGWGQVVDQLVAYAKHM